MGMKNKRTEFCFLYDSVASVQSPPLRHVGKGYIVVSTSELRRPETCSPSCILLFWQDVWLLPCFQPLSDEMKANCTSGISSCNRCSRQLSTWRRKPTCCGFPCFLKLVRDVEKIAVLHLSLIPWKDHETGSLYVITTFLEPICDEDVFCHFQAEATYCMYLDFSDIWVSKCFDNLQRIKFWLHSFLGKFIH